MEAKLTKQYNLADTYQHPKGEFVSQAVLVYFDETEVFQQPIWIQLYQTKSSLNCAIRVVYDGYDLRGTDSCSLDFSLAKHSAIKSALDKIGIEIPDFVFSEVSASLWICETTVIIAIARALNLNSKRWTFTYTNREGNI